MLIPWRNGRISWPVTTCRIVEGPIVTEENRMPMSRRDLIALIGTMSGAATMYQAMTVLGFAAESTYRGPIKLEGDPKGASVLILGARRIIINEALELRHAGHRD